MRECDHLLGRPSYYFLLSLGVRSSEPAALLVHNLQPCLALLCIQGQCGQVFLRCDFRQYKPRLELCLLIAWLVLFPITIREQALWEMILIPSSTDRTWPPNCRVIALYPTSTATIHSMFSSDSKKAGSTLSTRLYVVSRHGYLRHAVARGRFALIIFHKSASITSWYVPRAATQRGAR